MTLSLDLFVIYHVLWDGGLDCLDHGRSDLQLIICFRFVQDILDNAKS